jgi:hypothetical protein
MTAPDPLSTFLDRLSSYPPWLVVLAGTVAAAFLLWILAKAIKWLLWLLAIAVLVAGGITAIWLVCAR